MSLLTTGIRKHCELIYTRPIADTRSLAEVSLQSEELGLDTVSHGVWPPGAQWSNSSVSLTDTPSTTPFVNGNT